eukprot:356712-Chlamydomonas_euryale.AAC.2
MGGHDSGTGTTAAWTDSGISGHESGMGGQRHRWAAAWIQSVQLLLSTLLHGQGSPPHRLCRTLTP